MDEYIEYLLMSGQMAIIDEIEELSDYMIHMMNLKTSLRRFFYLTRFVYFSIYTPWIDIIYYFCSFFVV